MTEIPGGEHEWVTLRVPCQECGEVAVMRLTLEQAHRTATILAAAADGYERVDVEVRGEG